jgi:Protein of unknown function (DUF2924)
MTMPLSKTMNRLNNLEHLSKSEILSLWRELFQNEPPVEMRKDLMLRMVAQRMQEQQFGELSSACCRRLRQLATTIEADPTAVISAKVPIKSGTRMVRQWKDQVHVVNVTEKEFEYRGDRYESLSVIARLITGTRWSGPLFFGLKTKQSTSTEAQ